MKQIKYTELKTGQTFQFSKSKNAAIYWKRPGLEYVRITRPMKPIYITPGKQFTTLVYLTP